MRFALLAELVAAIVGAAIAYRRLVARFTPSLLAAAGAIITVAAIAPGDNAGLAR